MTSYDLAIIGAGPGGYVAALRGAQLGLNVVVIEKNLVGGTCLNVGCIPSKSYLEHAHWLSNIKKAASFGVTVGTPQIDFPQLVARKDQVVGTLRNGVEGLFKKDGVTLLRGEASFIGGKLYVSGQQVAAENIILAAGSKPFVPPINGLAEVAYDTTDTFFARQDLPKRQVIIGGGVIAVELAFALAPLGVETTLVEVAPDILLTEETEARKLVKASLLEQGVALHIGAKIQQVTAKEIILSDERIPYDHLLVAAGRRGDLTLAKQLGLKLENERFVSVDAHYQTSMPHIYAIGDLLNTYQLAHVASEEGRILVEHLAGYHEKTYNADRIPRCVYSTPEIATVGISEEASLAQDPQRKVVVLPYGSNAKALAQGATTGFVKVFVGSRYQEILGAVICGEHATELIHVVLAVMESEGTMQELSQMVFAHPAVSEIIGEAAKKSIFKAIHE